MDIPRGTGPPPTPLRHCCKPHSTLCNGMDYSLQGFSVNGILQARILEWAVMPSSRGSSGPRDQTSSVSLLSPALAGESLPLVPPAAAAAAAAKLLQSCPTLCDPHRRQPTRLRHPWDSPSKSTGVGCHFLLQCMKVKSESEVAQSLLVTPWTAAHQAPLSMGFSRQEYWSGVPLPSPLNLANGPQ